MKLRSSLLLLVLLAFSMCLVECTATTNSYCKKEKQNINCNQNKSNLEKSSSDVFPDNDLIIKI